MTLLTKALTGQIWNELLQIAMAWKGRDNIMKAVRLENPEEITCVDIEKPVPRNCMKVVAKIDE